MMKQAEKYEHIKTMALELFQENSGMPDYTLGRISVHPTTAMSIYKLIEQRDSLLEALINLHGVADVHDQSGMKAIQDAGSAIREAMRVE